MRSKAAAKKNSRTGIGAAPDDVSHVRPLPNYRVFVRFVDGTEGEVELKAFLFDGDAGVFERLRDPSEFAKVIVQEGAVTWPGGLDLAPDAMYDDIKGRGKRVAGRKRSR